MNYFERRNRLVNRLLRYEVGEIANPKVIQALRKVPRHLFVDPSQQLDAYKDYALPIACGQTISQPYIVALMSEWLALETEHRVLEIGTGSGYQTAVLAEIVKTVYTIEFHSHLCQRAQNLLDQLGNENIEFRCGDGYEGWPEEALFDRIIVTCRVETVPPQLEAQVKVGGRLLIPVGPEPSQILYAYKKEKNGLKALEKLQVRFVPLLRP